MPETGSQILSYRGDPNLGLGANASIPAINPNADLKTINDTASQLQYYNHANNIRLYEQKVKDRDDTLQMIADGQVAAGKIDPSDRKYYDEAKKKATDDFYEMIKNGGLNNPDAVRKYRESVTDLKNVATWAQHRELGLAQLDKELSEQTLPEDIQEYKKLRESATKLPFWNQIPIRQKAFDYDLNALTGKVQGNSMVEGQIGSPDAAVGTTAGTKQWNTVTDRNGVVTRKQTTLTSPVKSGQIVNPKGAKGVTISGTQVNPDGSFSEISYTPEKYWDLPTLQTNVNELSVSDPSSRYAFSRFLNDFDDKLPVDQQLITLKGYNNRIADYSNQRGIQPDGTNPDGTPHYPDQIKYYQDPVSKKVLIQETPESFFAKHALASVNGDYVEKSKGVLDVEAAKLNILKQRANADEFYKKAMAGAANTKARAYADNLKQQMKFRKTAQEQDDFLEEIWQRNLAQQPQLLEGTKAGMIPSKIQADNSLPVFTISGKNPIQLQPIDAKPITDPLTGKFMYWEGGYYEPEYILNGKLLDGQKLSELYINFLGQANNNFKNGKGEEWKGTVDDFIKEAVNEQVLDYKLRGANGTTDRKISSAAQRIISNTATKKGQTSIFDDTGQPPLDDQIPDNE